MRSFPDHRDSPGFSLPDREMLEVWLDVHRQTLLVKCDGLDDDQLRTRPVPTSTLSLLGLVRHMAEVERAWFPRVFAGEDAPPFWCDRATNPDGDFDDAPTADVDEAFATLAASVVRSREISDAEPDLDALSRGERHGERVSLRWILVHMIEEYARHNGHADLVRELVDGRTGE